MLRLALLLGLLAAACQGHLWREPNYSYRPYRPRAGQVGVDLSNVGVASEDVQWVCTNPRTQDMMIIASENGAAGTGGGDRHNRWDPANNRPVEQLYPNNQPNYPQPQPNYPTNQQRPNYPVYQQQPNYPVNQPQQPNYPVNQQQPNYPVNQQRPNYPQQNPPQTNYPANQPQNPPSKNWQFDPMDPNTFYPPNQPESRPNEFNNAQPTTPRPKPGFTPVTTARSVVQPGPPENNDDDDDNTIEIVTG